VIVDKAIVYLQSGRGGHGSAKSMSMSGRKVMGGGGDGGKGGDVIIKVTPHLYDLSKFTGKKKFIAGDGQNGKKNNKKGKDAPALIVNVPSGTRVIGESDEVIVDLVKQEDEFLICRGGREGKGNYKRDYTLEPQGGVSCEAVLDYRIPNDVVILGFANSGKTSLFNILTGQNYKVADYPFTTSSCIWSKGEYDFRNFTVLDTPPFKKRKDDAQHIENAFLHHIFRSKILIFLSDDCIDFKRDFSDLEKEILLYNPDILNNKKIFYLLNKIDKIDKAIRNPKITPISAKEGIGIEELKKRIVENLK